ncbi:hypothetical protein [Gimesia aquarii]|uniref:Ketohydroxyglutarate aldolase n=1 Tax=Gimesia aquarii TaxID=2527964 RepID=A0A517WYN2_9PLAN|nr:hypothetical protein [Gimesia aquarii]QDU10362.1 hypothetical protein V202x_37610 [Gimesia aquarii]
MSVEKVIITVADSDVSSIQSVADKLRSEGMKVDNVLCTSGIITGEVSKENRDKLKSVKGVLDVEPDEDMQAI